MADAERMQQWFVPAAVAAALLTAAYAGALLLLPEHLTASFSALALVAGEIAAAPVLLWRAQREHGRLRRAWLLLAGSAITSASIFVVWSYYQLARGESPPPIPSLADVFFVAAVVLVIPAMLQMPGSPIRAEDRLRTVLDGLIVAVSFTLVSWVTVLGPAFRTRPTDIAEALLLLGYPMGDVVGLIVAALVVMRAPAEVRVTIGLVAAGVASLALGDSLFTYLILRGHDPAGGLATVGWFAGYLLMALAALWRPTAAQERPAPPTRRTTVQGAILPTIAALLGLGVGFLATPDPFVVVAGFVLIVLVLGRQLLALGAESRYAAVLERQRDDLAAFAAAVESTDDSVIVTDLVGTIRLWNRGASQLYGYPREEALGKNFRLVMTVEQADRLGPIMDAVIGGESVKMTSRDQRKDGTTVPTSVTVSPVFGSEGAVTAVVGIARDITEQERAGELDRQREKQLEHLAFHDSLTGLANRALLNDRVAHALVSRRSGQVSILLLDLDDFKVVNDVSGHAAGDQLLIEVSMRLLKCLRADDTVARLGGDEFAILVADSDAELVAQRVTAELGLPILIEDREIVPSASIGIAHSDGIDDPGELLLRADVAMYEAKRAGTGRVVVFSEEMVETLRERADLVEALRQAVPRNEIVVHYQPIINVGAGTVSRFEALVRWKRPDGLVPPSAFLPLAEESGLIVGIGESVLRQALHALQGWLGEDGNRSVAVNLSAVQLASGDFPETVRALLAGSGVSASQLVLEVTETMFLDPMFGFVDQLTELRALGICVSIDDFGTGYSSLGRLQSLPVDSLKIDKSFVDLIAMGDEDLPVLRSMILMAHSLGLDVTAEGVETRVQAERITALGCDYLQGYHFSRPVGVEDALDGASSNATMTFAEVLGVDTIGSVVLVVEDDNVIRALMRAVLTAAAFEVEEAIAGAEGIALAREVEPDCVLVDLGLPDMDGLDVVRALRSEPTLRGSAIVVITGAAQRDVKSAAFAAGADDYIVKPVTPQHLPARIRGAVKSARSSNRGTGHP